MNRNIKCLLILVILLSVFAFQASATSVTYELDELGLEVSIPSTYDVITQDTPTSSSIFDDLGISGKELIDQFKTNGIYLNAIPNDTSNEEIVVTMTAGILDNLSVFSDTTIKALASALISGYEDYGIVVSDYDVYQHSQAKFIKIYFTDSTNSVYGLQFHTTYGTKAMNFTMRSYSGELSQKQEETITNIVDSIKYDTPPVSAPAVPETDAFVYTDVDTNTKFTVPANWYEEELSKDREFIDVKFVSGKEEGMSIMYGSTDLWSKMSESEKMGYSRSDFDTSQFTESDMKEYFGDVDNVKKVTYNGIDYFLAVQKAKQEMYGTEFIVEMTRVVRFYNGWLYEFQFSGTTDSIYFDDLEVLLDSVQYAGSSNVSLISNDNNTSKNSTNNSVFWGVVVILLLLGIVAVVIWYVRKNKEVDNELLSTDLLSEIPKCSNCGIELAHDSLFCHICGAKNTNDKGDEQS